MKHTIVTYIVKNEAGKTILTTELKPLAVEAVRNYNGTITKRIATVEELTPQDKDFTVWA